MVQNNGKRENQHYVPKSLLRIFSFDKKQKKTKEAEQYIFSYDKHIDKIFTPNIGGIVCEKWFYDFGFDSKYRSSFEPYLSGLENKCKCVIQKIIESENLFCLKEEDKLWLRMFIAVQYLRVKKQRIVFKELHDGVAERIRKMGLDLGNIEGFPVLNGEDIKHLSLDGFHRNVPVIEQLIGEKTWLLFKTSTSQHLYVSDNTVLLGIIFIL